MEYLVISGSARPTANTHHVAKYAARLLAKRPETTVKEWNVGELALGDLETPAWTQEEKTPVFTQFLADVARADGFVLVVPEYNHGYPGALKNVLDHIRHEWARKPFALVSTGGVSGGIRAAEQLRQVIPELKATSVPASVAVQFVMRGWDTDGPPTGEEDTWAERFTTTYDDLDWWAAALKAARDNDSSNRQN